MAVNKTAEIRKLIFVNHEASFTTPKVKTGDFILMYAKGLEEKMKAKNVNFLKPKEKNKVLSEVVEKLIKHWKDKEERNLEDKSQYLKLMKQTQKLADFYDGLKNKGLYLTDVTWIENRKVEMDAFIEFEDVRPRRGNCEVNFYYVLLESLLILKEIFSLKARNMASNDLGGH